MARAAEPGEFTKRAFLNGRIDLSQAESVMDVNSGKKMSMRLKSSLQQLKGAVRTAIEETAQPDFISDRVYRVGARRSGAYQPGWVS